MSLLKLLLDPDVRCCCEASKNPGPTLPLFWTTADLENKLLDFRTYFNNHRTHRVTRWKGERRIRPCLDQSPISTRFNGNLIVGPSIRHRWLPDFSKIRARYGIRSLQKPRTKSPVLCLLSCTALRGSDGFTAAVSIHQRPLRRIRKGRVEFGPPAF